MADSDLQREVEEELQRANSCDYYELLGVSRSASENEIRSAFRKKAKRFHVDAHANLDDAELRQKMQAVFGVLSEAQKTLLKPELREDYDASLQDGGVDRDAQQEFSNIFRAEQIHKQARRLLERGELDLARKKLEECVTLDPNEEGHHVWLAWVQYSLLRQRLSGADPAMSAKLKDALERCRRKVEDIAKKSPKNADASLILGHVARVEDRRNDAIRHFEAVVKINPRHSEALSNLRHLRRRAEKKSFLSSLFGKKGS